MKVWVIPVMLPDPEEDVADAEAARQFIAGMGGFVGFAPMTGSKNTGVIFDSIEKARSAKWRFDEFSEAGAQIIEGTLSTNKKALILHRVLK